MCMHAHVHMHTHMCGADRVTMPSYTKARAVSVPQFYGCTCTASARTLLGGNLSSELWQPQSHMLQSQLRHRKAKEIKRIVETLLRELEIFRIKDAQFRDFSFS